MTRFDTKNKDVNCRPEGQRAGPACLTHLPARRRLVYSLMPTRPIAPAPPMSTPTEITLPMMRQAFTSAVVSDALDAAGYPRQSPRVPLKPQTVDAVLVGRCKTTLWAEMAHPDPKPYELELIAVDGCRPDDVLIAAASGSLR